MRKSPLFKHFALVHNSQPIRVWGIVVLLLACLLVCFALLRVLGPRVFRVISFVHWFFKKQKQKPEAEAARNHTKAEKKTKQKQLARVRFHHYLLPNACSSLHAVPNKTLNRKEFYKCSPFNIPISFFSLIYYNQHFLIFFSFCFASVSSL